MLDNNYNQMYFVSGDPLTSQATLPTLNTTYEAYVRNTSVRKMRDIGLLLYVQRKFTDLDITYFWPINLLSPLTQLYGNTNIVATGTYTADRGLTGDGAAHFKLIDSTILDINNFTIGINVLNNTNAGIDFGVSDGTNEISLSTRDTNVGTVKVGTATDTFASLSSIGVWILRVAAGSITVYKDYVSLSTGTPVAGSNPNLNLFMSALNDDGVTTDYTQRTYGAAFIHNGLLSEADAFKTAEIMYFYTNFK